MLILGGPASAQEASSDVSATNLDGLITALSADPHGRQAVTALLLLKGAGRQQGDKVTWHVEFRGGHLFLNGTDVSQIIPHK